MGETPDGLPITRRLAANALVVVAPPVAVAVGVVGGFIIIIGFAWSCYRLGFWWVTLVSAADVAVVTVLILLAVIGRLRLLDRPIGGRIKRVTASLTLAALVLAGGAAYALCR